MENFRHQIGLVLARVTVFESELVRTPLALAQRDSRVTELEAQVVELQWLKTGFKPNANTFSRPKMSKDGRAKGERKHSGVVRSPVELGLDDMVHNLRSTVCLEWSGTLEGTGEFDGLTVEGIPPRVEVLVVDRTGSVARAAA